MALLTHRPGSQGLEHLTQESALDRAWGIWFALAVIPFLLFVLAIWHLAGQEPGEADRTLALYFAAAPTAVLMFAFPASPHNRQEPPQHTGHFVTGV
jgi:hypothetical protein